MNLPAGFLLPPPPPPAFLKKINTGRTFPSLSPCSMRDAQRDIAAAPAAGPPKGPAQRLPLSRRLPECQRDYYYFGRGSGGDLVLNKVSVQPLPVPCTKHQSSHLAEVSWNSHPAH